MKIETEIKFAIDKSLVEDMIAKIEKAIIKLKLQEAKRINRAYLGLWEDYKKEHGISDTNMMFHL